MNSRYLMIAAWGLFFLCQVAHCQTKSSETRLTANPVFINNCARCHGATAEGRHFRGPALISEKVANASVDDLLKITTNGKGHMPKFGEKLTSDEINLLVQQIKTLNKK